MPDEIKTADDPILKPGWEASAVATVDKIRELRERVCLEHWEKWESLAVIPFVSIHGSVLSAAQRTIDRWSPSLNTSCYPYRFARWRGASPDHRSRARIQRVVGRRDLHVTSPDPRTCPLIVAADRTRVHTRLHCKAGLIAVLVKIAGRRSRKPSILKTGRHEPSKHPSVEVPVRCGDVTDATSTMKAPHRNSPAESPRIGHELSVMTSSSVPIPPARGAQPLRRRPGR